MQQRHFFFCLAIVVLGWLFDVIGTKKKKKPKQTVGNFFSEGMNDGDQLVVEVQQNPHYNR